MVPRYIEEVVEKKVDVITEILVEKVVPVHKVKKVKKRVEVPVYTVEEKVVKKKLRQQSVQTVEHVVAKPVKLNAEVPAFERINKTVQVTTQRPKVVDRAVSIPVPCNAKQSNSDGYVYVDPTFKAGNDSRNLSTQAATSAPSTNATSTTKATITSGPAANATPTRNATASVPTTSATTKTQALD